MRLKAFGITLLILACTISCSTSPKLGKDIQPNSLKDGIFEGTYKHGPNEADVRVTIENQRLVKVEIIRHDAWKGKKANDIIPGRIVEKQSTRVEAVSGATNSSYVIMNAVQNALDKAVQ